MDYQAFYRHVRLMFSNNWTSSPVVWPNEPMQPFEPVGDQGSASYPASMLLVDFNDEQADFGTFDGTDQVDGSLVVTICVEAGAGEDKLFDLFDRLKAMFATYGDSSTDALQFLVPRLGGMVAFEDLPLFGREAHFPFKRWE
jgi:hypothetical protein